MKFMDYFTGDVEYPGDVALNPLPMGVSCSYISSTFLNGFINYVTIVKAFVLGRYHAWDEEISHEITVQDPPGSLKWTKKECKTKDDLFRELVKKNVICHAKLDCDFQDDVLILAKAGEIEGGGICYFFFWYDRDCSDCCIGRFETNDDEAEVINRFVSYATDSENNELGEAREIPLHYFQGWLKG